MQTMKSLGLIIPLTVVALTGCTPEEVDYAKIDKIVSDNVAFEVSKLLKEQANKAEGSKESSTQLIQFKSIEYPRFAAIVAYRMNRNENGALTGSDIEELKGKLTDLESDLYLQTFYSSLKTAAGFTKEVVPLETKNRSGYRIRNAYDMILSPDSYFAENFPVNGRIVMSEELVPYPECKEGYRPILLHSALHKVGESVVEPFDINTENEAGGWRITFDGYRAMTDLACVPAEVETDAEVNVEKLLGE